MIIIDTPFHITFRSLQDLPIFACTDKCKKVFWETDMEDEISKYKCSTCGGLMTEAVSKVHFKILSKANRNLKLSDIKAYANLNNTDKKRLQQYLEMGSKIMHLSYVKPQFEKKAITEWLPHLLKAETSTKIN